MHYIGVAQSGTPASLDTGNLIDGLNQAMSFVALSFYIAGGMVLMMWIIRVRTNLAALGVSGLKFNDVDAAGAFMIPVYNLFKPFQAMQETWQASGWDANSEANVFSNKSCRAINFWWLTWIGMNICGVAVGIAAAQLKVPGHQLPVIMAFFQANCIYQVVAISAAAAAINVIAQITLRVEHKHAHLQPIPSVSE